MQAETGVCDTDILPDLEAKSQRYQLKRAAKGEVD